MHGHTSRSHDCHMTYPGLVYHYLFDARSLLQLSLHCFLELLPDSGHANKHSWTYLLHVCKRNSHSKTVDQRSFPNTQVDLMVSVNNWLSSNTQQSITVEHITKNTPKWGHLLKLRYMYYLCLSQGHLRASAADLPRGCWCRLELHVLD